MADLRGTKDRPISVVEWLDNSPELRPFPAVATRVMVACEDPKANSETLARVIECDAALAMQLLRAANSSMYGFTGEIRTIEHASVVLGFRALKSLAVSIAGAKMFSQGDTAQSQRHELWQHSLACATVARLVASHVHDVVPEEAFLAGIFHDVGKLVFYDLVPDDYLDLDCSDAASPLIEQEADVFGVNHQQVGQRCGEDWGLPVETCHAIGFHHTPTAAPQHTRLVALTNLANRLSKEWSLGGDRYHPRDDGEEVSPQQLGLDDEALAMVRERAPRDVEDTKTACGL